MRRKGVIDEDKLNKVLESVPEDWLKKYKVSESKLTGTVISNYLMLGVKSVNAHYTKTHYGLCLDCLEKGVCKEDAMSYGQKNQFKRKMCCPCRKSRPSSVVDSVENLQSIVAHLPKITFKGKEGNDTILLSCTDHGNFTKHRNSYTSSKTYVFCCDKCYHESLGVLKKKEFKGREFREYKPPYPKGLEFTKGNKFTTPKGNTLTITETLGRKVKVYCDTCYEYKDVYTSNLGQEQVPCKCRGVKKYYKGGSVKTKHGNTLKIVEADSTHFFVTCNICHADEELWKEPLKILRGTLYSGSSPCACSKSCLYTKQQYEVKINRKLKNITCDTTFSIRSDTPNIKTPIDFKCKTSGEIYTRKLQPFLTGKDTCAVCEPSVGGFDNTKEGYFYLMVFESTNDDNHVFKVGITNRKPMDRFKEIKKYLKGYVGRISVVVHITDGKSCESIEKIFKGIYTSKGCTALKVRFKSGFTETFPWDMGVLQDLHNDFFGYLGIDFTSSYYEPSKLPDHKGYARLTRKDEWGY